MEAIERNEPLLRKVGDYIAAHPKNYEQSSWHGTILDVADENVCGTTMCVAGATVFLMPEFVRFGVSDDAVCIMKTEGGGRVRKNISGVARDALGMTSLEVGALFDGNWLPLGATDNEDPELHLKVRDALYRLADGAEVEEVTDPEYYREW